MRVITSENNWVCISNEFCGETKPIKSQETEKYIEDFELRDLLKLHDISESGNLFVFKTTPKISSYLFALAAGPYVAIPNEDVFKYPMTIYCRKTKKEIAEAPEKFRTIMIAIKFFEDYF